MRNKHASFAQSLLASLFVLGGASLAHAADYRVQLDNPITISNVIAVDKDTDGTLHFSSPYSLTQGLNTLTNVNQSPNVSSYFLVGTFYLPDDGKNHSFFTMTQYGATAAAGLRFSQTFVGFNEPPAIAAITNFTSGLDVPGGQAYLTSLANTYGSYLFTRFDEQGVAMRFTVSATEGTVNPVPVPAAVSQGAVVLGLLGLGALVKRAAGRRSA